MSRLTDALEVLVNRCTNGAEPDGERVCDLVECLAAHFNGGKLVVNVKGNDTTITSADKTYSEILAAYNLGKTIEVNFYGSIYQLSFVGGTYFRFSRLFVKSTYADVSGLMVSNDDTWTRDVHELYNYETTT